MCVFVCVNDVFHSCHPRTPYVSTNTISKGGAIVFALIIRERRAAWQTSTTPLEESRAAQPHSTHQCTTAAVQQQSCLCDRHGAFGCVVCGYVCSAQHDTRSRPYLFRPSNKKTRVCRYDTAAVSLVLCQRSAKRFTVYQVLDVYKELEHAVGLVWFRRWMINSA